MIPKPVVLPPKAHLHFYGDDGDRTPVNYQHSFKTRTFQWEAITRPVFLIVGDLNNKEQADRTGPVSNVWRFAARGLLQLHSVLVSKLRIFLLSQAPPTEALLGTSWDIFPFF